MANQIKNNSQLLYLQAKQLFEEARVKFEDGTIKSEPLLVSSVFNAFQAFFTSMGKPNLIPRYAPEEGPPWSEDYNDMMTEIRKDLELLFQELDILGRSLYTDFNHNMVQHDILSKQYETVLDKMRDLELYAGVSTDKGVEFGRDDFLNKNKIDYSRIAGTPLEIVDGAVTLPQVSRENVALDAQVSIVVGNRKANKFILGTESNGFPGNNTEIHSVTDDVLTSRNYVPTFLGEENNHSDYSAVLDGTPNTWFEYEKVNVREQDRVRVAKNLGWDYQVHESQVIDWAEDPEGGILKLHMQIILPEERIINQINCNMYTPPNYGAKAAIVKNILVSDGKGVPVSVLPANKKDDDYSFHFHPTKAKVVDVLFEQPHKYITDLGHIYYEKKMQVQDSSEYAMDMATKRYKYAPRVQGPLVSLEDLGIEVKVSESNVEANYLPRSTAQVEARSIGEIINRLTDGVDAETVDVGVEKFEGFRWCIGVRDIEIFSSEYATEGELVTTPFYFEKPMDKISLDVSENIPTAFTTNESLKYEWLSYFVSVDDGATWYPITPIKQQVISDDQPPKIYTVRTVESSDQILDTKAAYIESEYPVYSLRMKIVARRPEDFTAEGFRLKDSAGTALTNNTFNQSSPVVSSYMFNVATLNSPSDSAPSDKMAANLNSLSTIDPGVEEFPAVLDAEGDPYAQKLNVTITNKKDDWCLDEDLVIKALVSSGNTLVNAELYINGSKKDAVTLSGNSQEIEFKIPSSELTQGVLTATVKGYDVNGSAIDSDVLSIIDCTGLPPEDRPADKDSTKLKVVIDKRTVSLCVCDTLTFNGTVQGPDKIQGISFSINGNSFDPNDLGVAPDDDECSSATAKEFGMQSTQKITDEELLNIEDFGEFLDAFEEREDCGCKKKRQNALVTYGLQTEPIRLMQIYEEAFSVTLPYWKLKELGVTPDSKMTVEVRAVGAFNATASDSFTADVSDCGSSPEEGCLELESVEIHYYNPTSGDIESQTIPANALPFDGVDNGAGSSVTVGWNGDSNSIVVMQTAGEDASGYSFQIHALAIHYLDSNNEPNKKWASKIEDKSTGALNSTKMLGDASRAAAWLSDIKNGDYSTSPSLAAMNDYVIFGMDDEWKNNACLMDIDTFIPDPINPGIPGPLVSDCGAMTDIVIQYYDESKKQLAIYKANLTANAKDTHSITTKNGITKLAIGWSENFNGPAVKILSASGKDNLLLTAVGVAYVDLYGHSQVAWANDVAFYTAGVKNPEYALFDKKSLTDVSWINNSVVNYNEASYVGGTNDFVAYSISDEVANILCAPLNYIDIEGDGGNSLFLRSIDFPLSICADADSFEIKASAEDMVYGLSEVTYSVSINDEVIYGPYTDSTEEKLYLISVPFDASNANVGDTVTLNVMAKNKFGQEAHDSWEFYIAMCTPISPPSIEVKPPKDSSGNPNYNHCYSDIQNGTMPLSLHITSEAGIGKWEVTSNLSKNWMKYKDYTGTGEVVTDTGSFTVDVPCPLPSKGTDELGRTYCPDQTIEFTVKAVDKDLRVSELKPKLYLKDCNPLVSSQTHQSGRGNATLKVAYLPERGAGQIRIGIAAQGKFYMKISRNGKKLGEIKSESWIQTLSNSIDFPYENDPTEPLNGYFLLEITADAFDPNNSGTNWWDFNTWEDKF
ncbi:hypothetical protein ACWA2C_16965 [Priestia megaterium]